MAGKRANLNAPAKTGQLSTARAVISDHAAHRNGALMLLAGRIALQSGQLRTAEERFTQALPFEDGHLGVGVARAHDP